MKSFFILNLLIKCCLWISAQTRLLKNTDPDK